MASGGVGLTANSELALAALMADRDALKRRARSTRNVHRKLGLERELRLMNEAIDILFAGLAFQSACATLRMLADRARGEG